MYGRWRFNDQCKLRLAMVLAFVLIFHQNLSFCWSLNNEGLLLLRFRDSIVSDPFGALSNWNSNNEGDFDPCSWLGVECSDGKVIILNLRDLCLGGTLAPEIGKLTNIKSIILRNNSLYGNIPKEIEELKELEELDLGYNNFSGPIPSDLVINHSLSIFLLDNNKFLGSISPELYDLKMLSELQVDENHLTGAASRASCNSRSGSWNTVQPGDIPQRRLQQVGDTSITAHDKRGLKSRVPSFHSSSPLSSLALSPRPSSSLSSPLLSPSGSPISSISKPPTSLPSPSPSPSEFLAPSISPTPPASPPPLAPADPPVTFSVPPQSNSAISPSPASTSSQTIEKSTKSKHHAVMILSGVIGGSVFIFLSTFMIVFCRSSKVVTVKPWATGLSGQLQKAFITGVPKLQRSELEIACEDFSNIIGSLSDGMVYKGTLSTGVEIAVTSTTVKSAKDWSKNLETKFRNKIEMLSKMNHKNFVNLIGFCEEEKPFTRMMVFEYAPNGTLFEHLHIKEAEHLDWKMRLRIAMGMAYCLEYMHQLSPPIAHGNLQSSSIYLTEDYAAKISDFSFWNEVTAAKMGSATTKLLGGSLSDPESNVYSFGVVLFELITGRLPFSVGSGSLVDWASDYLSGKQSVREMVDPILSSFVEEELEKLFEVIKDCVHPDPKQRSTMKEVTAKLQDITAVGPDGATPKVSPLWWAELEIMSTDSSNCV